MTPCWPLRCAALMMSAILAGCGKGAPPALESLDVTPGVTLVPTATRAGRPLAVTYRWTVAPHAPPVRRPYRAFVHFVAGDGAILIHDDHVPQPPPDTWEPGRTFEY